MSVQADEYFLKLYKNMPSTVKTIKIRRGEAICTDIRVMASTAIIIVIVVIIGARSGVKRKKVKGIGSEVFKK